MRWTQCASIEIARFSGEFEASVVEILTLLESRAELEPKFR
jgi:hypothetical protein